MLWGAVCVKSQHINIYVTMRGYLLNICRRESHKVCDLHDIYQTKPIFTKPNQTESKNYRKFTFRKLQLMFSKH